MVVDKKKGRVQSNSELQSGPRAELKEQFILITVLDVETNSSCAYTVIQLY